MRNSIDLGRSVSKEDYKKELPELRSRLLEAQRALRTAGIRVLIIIEGLDGSGRAEVVNKLHEWLDPRGLQTHTFWNPSDEELERPAFWRFWRVLPGAGEIALFLGGWYREIITDATHERIKNGDLDARLTPILALEAMLASDRTLILKFWYHLPSEVQEQRLKEEHSTPDDRWPSIKAAIKGREALAQWAERILRHSDTADAPWFSIEAEDVRYRDLATGYTLLEGIEKSLAVQNNRRSADIPPPEPALPLAASARITVLDHVDLSANISKSSYDTELADMQNEIRSLLWRAHALGISTYLVFEGWDAAGKGGTIRKLTAGMDARLYRVIPYGAPSSHELAHHYLWRFWRQVPRAGRVAIFDRSWYGRVLVERVEGFASQAEWQRAYHDINEFEEQLVNHKGLLLKFWLHISPEEQLRRFEDRQNTPWKNYKITPDDWRNREKRPAYELAVNEMVLRTDTEFAPWHLVANENKEFGRLRVLEIVRDTLKKRVKAAE
ncbi:MAG: polyphosphate:AMP phosphotransferase [Gammaproteobacteria bacterium 28-57-27]|nr:MAG: polyphosphate:AMP phosphotransferase [Gammaproteobacteria bacterium 28-57-27]